jgi:hypothetical protein
MFPGGGGRCTEERRCKAKQGRHSKTALTYESCLYNSTDFAPRTRGVKDLFGNAHLKVISSLGICPVFPKYQSRLEAVKETNFSGVEPPAGFGGHKFLPREREAGVPRYEGID